jgi:hypothetical protein
MDCNCLLSAYVDPLVKKFYTAMAAYTQFYGQLKDLHTKHDEVFTKLNDLSVKHQEPYTELKDLCANLGATASKDKHA